METTCSRSARQRAVKAMASGTFPETSQNEALTDVPDMILHFPEDGFVASEGLKKNKEAFNLLREAFAGKSIPIHLNKMKKYGNHRDSDEKNMNKNVKFADETPDLHENPTFKNADLDPDLHKKEIPMMKVKTQPLEMIEEPKSFITAADVKPLLFCLDFDNTCAFEYFPEVGPDVPYAEQVLKRMQEAGHKIILWTARTGQQLADAVHWFNEKKIVLYGINDNPSPDPCLAEKYGIPRKIVPDWFIDDRNLGCPLKTFVTEHDPETGKHVEHEAVDWIKLEEIMIQRKILPYESRSKEQ